MRRYSYPTPKPGPEAKSYFRNLTPGLAFAQTDLDRIELSVGYSSWAGDNVEGLEAGPRFQATLFGSTEGGLGIGLTGVRHRVGIVLPTGS